MIRNLLLFLALLSTAQAQYLKSISTSKPTASTVTIKWSTCALTSSSVSYGTTANYGNIAQTPGQVTTHAVPLSSLLPGQLYHFAVTSVDQTGAIVTSLDQTFTTASGTTPPPPPPPPPPTQNATLISHGDSIVAGQAEFGNPTANGISLATTSAIGDMTIITAWCDDDQTFEAVDGGCTPLSLTYGSNPTPTRTSVAMAKSPADPITNDAGTGQGFIYYVLSNTAANQTITFTGAETRQYQVAYLTFRPGSGYAFTHNSSMDSALGSGQSGFANLPSYALASGNAPAVVINFTACSSHCTDPISSTWSTLTWSTGFKELQESENLFAYALAAGAGTFTNGVTVLNGDTAKWQGLISSFQLVATQ